MHKLDSPTKTAIVVRRANARLVVIDGTFGSGKTTLAKALARRLGYTAFHLDKFVAKRRGGFIKYLRHQRLIPRIKSSRRSIVEGVCALRALERMRLGCNLLIYVKRVSHGVWTDEQELVPLVGLESHIETLRSEDATICGAIGRTPDFAFEEEIIRYHANYTPYIGAGIEYCRADA